MLKVFKTTPLPGKFIYSSETAPSKTRKRPDATFEKASILSAVLREFPCFLFFTIILALQ
jgi:hypothetical protein